MGWVLRAISASLSCFQHPTKPFCPSRVLGSFVHRPHYLHLRISTQVNIHPCSFYSASIDLLVIVFHFCFFLIFLHKLYKLVIWLGMNPVSLLSCISSSLVYLVKETFGSTKTFALACCKCGSLKYLFNHKPH